MTETKALLILSKATRHTGGLEALRAQINIDQNQKCFGMKDLPLATPPTSQQIGNLGSWEVTRGPTTLFSFIVVFISRILTIVSFSSYIADLS